MNSFGTNQTFVNMGWHKYLVYPLSKKALYHSGSAELSKLIVHEYQHDSRLRQCCQVISITSPMTTTTNND